MAEVEKININSTDYDIADAKALRTKDTVGVNSFIDTRAGSEQYPTDLAYTQSLILGAGSYISSSGIRSGITIIGDYAYASLSYSTILGYIAHGTSMSTSIGYNANSGDNSIAIGSNAAATSNSAISVGSATFNNCTYGIVIGYNAGISTSGGGNRQFDTVVGASSRVAGNVYNTILGASSNTGTSASYNVICGTSNTISNYVNFSAILGHSATVSSSYSVQLGSGSNSNHGSLQFREWPLVDNNGKIYEERLPSVARFTTDEPAVLDWQDGEELRKLAFMYTGEDNALFKHGLCYQATPKQGHPKFWCGYISTDYIPRNECVQIDNEKLFVKLAEISKARYEDEGNWENSLIGGDNAEQCFYFYYNVNDAQWSIGISNDTFEYGFRSTPNTYYFEQGETLEDFGIYVKNLTLPTDEDTEEEMFDIYYYAPAYCDGYGFGSDIKSVNYIQMMEAMCDGDWGFGWVIDNIESWGYEVDETTYHMPVIPETYISKQDGDEYDGVTVRWEWDDDRDVWFFYINGEDTGYRHTTAQLEQNFGIVLDATAEDTEYIEFYFRGAKQLYWQQFNPIDDTEFAKQEDLETLETQVQPLLDWKVNEQTGNVYNLNNYTTPGWYYFPKASNVTNKPNTLGIGFMLLVQKNNNNVISQHLFACVSNNIVGSTNYSYDTPIVYSRVFAFNYWYAWQTYLTNGTMCNVITGYDSTKKQSLVHDSSANKLKWEDGSGGGTTYTAGDGIDITNDTISVDNLDCGTM